MDALETAQHELKMLPTREGVYWIRDSLKKIRDYLATEKSGVSKLDPTGRKTAAEIERDLAGMAADAALRAARKDYRQLLGDTRHRDMYSLKTLSESISESLAYLGKDVTALEESGQVPAAEIADRMKSGVKRHCLNTARDKYNEYVTSNLAGWADLCDHIEGQIKQHLEGAGAKVEDLDPKGTATRQELEGRMAETRRRLNLLKAREELKDYETSTTGVYADHPDALEAAIKKHLAIAGQPLDMLEPGQSAAAIEARFRKAADRVRLNGAVDCIRDLLASKDKGPEDTLYKYRVENAKKFLAAANPDTVTSDRQGKKITHSEVSTQLAGILHHLPLARLSKELEDFERSPASGSADAIRKAATRLTEAFNDAGIRQLLVSQQGQDAPEKTQKRIDAAARRLWEEHCQLTGKIPVMKTLRLGQKQST